MGCEALDLTEIPGADSLYAAEGIIAESEAYASALFGCPTFYSTEGSSHCIRAMLLLASQASGILRDSYEFRHQASEDGGKAFPLGGRCHPASPASRMTDEGRTDAHFRVLAARNVHSAFLSAVALLDLDVVWLPGAGDSYLSAAVTPERLDAALAETGASAVYLTCPDYLGNLPDLAPLAAVCHARGALLLVDNAHGAYLRFLTPSRHPMDLGADLCCDSAHKTLPVLTGGAYLHVSKSLAGAACEMQNAKCKMQNEDVRDALALFGSTSPSYLILQSLDLANPYLETLPEMLAEFLPKVEALKERLRAAGWTLTGDEPLKLTLSLVGAAIGRPPEANASGISLAGALEQEGIFCEFADPEHVVFMLSPNNTDGELERLETALSKAAASCGRPMTVPTDPVSGAPLSVTASPCHLLVDASCASKAVATAMKSTTIPRIVVPLKGKALREAMLGPAERIPAAESLGRVLARPGVSCPPAVPILMPGEIIDEAAITAFEKYGIAEVSVLL